MKDKFSKNQINRIICTSVDDAKTSLRFVSDRNFLHVCLDAEQTGMNRVSMINNIRTRINQLGRKQEFKL